MIVVADTGRLHYLILLDHTNLLHRFYGEVVVPDAVAAELTTSSAPDAVRDWMSRRPAWLRVVPSRTSVFSKLRTNSTSRSDDGSNDVSRHRLVRLPSSAAPRSRGAVLEHERCTAVTVEHFQHQARPIATQRVAQAVMQRLKWHRRIFCPGEHQQR
jgi:hypothetical protein